MITINFIQGYPDQTSDVAIGDQTFTIRVKWNERFAFWSMGIYDRESTPIATGMRMVRDSQLIGFLGLSQFDGDFIFIRIYGDKDEADFDSLGDDFTLVYVSGDEINAVVSADS